MELKLNYIAYYIAYQTHIPILLEKGAFGESELILPFLFLSINASNINGFNESGLTWSGGGFGIDGISSTESVWLEILVW